MSNTVTTNIGRKRIGRYAVLAATVASASLALAACSPSTGSQSGQAAKEPEPPAIELGDYYTHPTDIEVPGLTGQKIISSTGTEARWSYLPGQEPFNTQLASLVADHIGNQASARDVAYKPEVHEPSDAMLERGCVAGSTALTAREILDDPELSLPAGSDVNLTVACDTVLASGKNYGQKLRFVRGDAQSVASDYIEILYTNTDTGEVARGRELLSGEGLRALYDAAFDLLNLEQPMSGDEVIPPSDETLSEFRGALSNVGVDGQGDTYVTVDQDYVAIMAAGDPDVQILPTTFKIPAGRAHLDLTELGVEISRSMAEGEEWSGPAPVKPGQEYVDCNLSPCLAVTYDDGPSYLTPTVLDAYADLPYAATTFFVLGQNIEGQEEIIKRAHDEGHEIANHSWSHPAFTALTDEAIIQEVSSTNDALTAITGEPIVHHRPPYGDLNDRTLATAGMPAIMWSVDTNDWQHPGIESVVQQSVYDSEPDGIVLMHDIHDDTVAAAREIAETLLKRGYTLVTISQLFQGEELPAVPFYTAEEYRN